LTLAGWLIIIIIIITDLYSAFRSKDTEALDWLAVMFVKTAKYTAIVAMECK